MSLLNEIYFIDIETVPVVKDLNMLPGNGEDLFRSRNKEEIIRQRDVNGSITAGEDIWDKSSSFQAEFSRVACVSIGKMQLNTETPPKPIFYVKSIVDRDESKILNALTLALQKATILCAHNGKEFDFPFLFRRYVINNIPVPGLLQVAGKKTWDIPHLDTMELWSHMQWKYRCSLDLLCYVLGFPSPKKDLNGSDIARLWYEPVPSDALPFDHDEALMKIITTYCAGDVVACANVFCRLKGYELIREEQIKYV